MTISTLFGFGIANVNVLLTMNGDNELQYVGLDVSQDVTHACVVDRDGNRQWEGDCLSTPEAIGETVKKHAPDVVKIGLESGHLSTWHWHGLQDMDLPAICIDAYHAHGVLRL